MQICRQLAGYSYGRADLVRRAMAKKKADVMEQERENFIHGKINEDGSVECVGCVANGVDEKTANDLFNEMSSFAAYAFNKSHAAAYAIVAYQTAYLKVHYLREYMAALLTSVLGNTDKVIEYTAVCAAQGIKVLPPDINTSDIGFAVHGRNLSFGLLAVKNLGRGVIEKIIDERETAGPFRSLPDFIERMYGKDVNKRAIESLIKCGAFDSFPHNRMEMMRSFEGIVDSVDDSARRNVAGQLDLFSAVSGGEMTESTAFTMPKLEDFSLKERLAMEKEVTGLYLSGHPLDGVPIPSGVGKLTPISDIVSVDEEGLTGYREGDGVTILCTLQSKKVLTTRSRNQMAFLTVEDRSGSLEVIVFPTTFERHSRLLMKDAILLIEGKVSHKEDESPKVVCDSVRDFTDLRDGAAAPRMPEVVLEEPESAQISGKLYLKFSAQSDPALGQALEILSESRGENPVYFYFEDSKKTMNWKKHGIALSERLLDKLKRVVKEQNIAVR